MMQQQWRKSSRCDAGSCVEVTERPTGMLMRDGKLGDASPVLAFDRDSWRALLAALRSD